MSLTTATSITVWLDTPHEEYRNVNEFVKPEKDVTDDEYEESVMRINVSDLILNAIWDLTAWDESLVAGWEIKMTWDDANDLPYTIESFSEFVDAVEEWLKTRPTLELTEAPYLYNRGSEHYVDNEWRYGTLIFPTEILEILEKKND